MPPLLLFLDVAAPRVAALGSTSGMQANGRDEEFTQLFGQLTPDQQDLVLAQLRGIVNRKDK